MPSERLMGDGSAIPFRKTLSFKLFISYVLVVLVTVLTTLAVHYLGVKSHISEIMRKESKVLAQELRPEAEGCLAEDHSENLEEFVKFAQASTRHGVSFVSFETGRSDSVPLFSLTEDEIESLRAGNDVGADAHGRIDVKSMPEMRAFGPGPRRRLGKRGVNGKRFGPGQRGPWRKEADGKRLPRGPWEREMGDKRLDPEHRGPEKGAMDEEECGPTDRPPSDGGGKGFGFHGAPQGGIGHQERELGHFEAVPLSQNGEVVGALVVFNTKPVQSQRVRMLLQSASNGLAIALLPALLCALFLSRNITRPVRRMEVVAMDYGNGNFSTRTDLKREDELGVLARAFDNMASELEQNIANRTRLLTDVSHEIGTPITTIRATLEALIDKLVEPDQSDLYLQSSLNELEHLSRIFSDITELSRFETGEIGISKGVFSAERPVQQSVEAAQILAGRKNIRVQVAESDPDLRVLGDQLRITQVLKNLVMNAVQHNPEGTIVTAFWTETAEAVKFVVEDNGTVISDEDSSRIFERFYKVSQSRTRDDSSSGLGLAIVSRILREHGTDIELVTTSKGKSFSFSLPKA